MFIVKYCISNFLPGISLYFTSVHVYSLVTARMHEEPENPFLVMSIMRQEYSTKCSDTILIHHCYWCKILCCVALMSTLLFCFSLCISRYRRCWLFLFSYFFFFFCLGGLGRGGKSVTFQSTKIIKKKKEKKNSASKDDTLMFCEDRLFIRFIFNTSLYFLSKCLSMLLMAICAGMNFSLLVPSWDRLCTEICEFSF